MQDAWLSFARTGTPQSAGLPPLAATTRRPGAQTMELGERSALVDAPNEAERAFWDGLSR